VVQLLYDLNDVSFDLISKNNFELDTTWPTIDLQNNSKYTSNRAAKNRMSMMRNGSGRTRNSSISSFASTANMLISSNNGEQQVNINHIYDLFVISFCFMNFKRASLTRVVIIRPCC
jgi:hypothetical protein